MPRGELPMLRRSFARAVVVLAGLVLALGLAPTVWAQSLDELRAQGVVAERYDGLLEVRVDDPPEGAEALVQRVNAERRQIYRKRAASEGVPAEEVGKVYAKQILGKAPEGTYFRKPDGSYTRK